MNNVLITPVSRSVDGVHFRSTTEACFYLLLASANLDISYQPLFVVDPNDEEEMGWYVDFGIRLNGKSIYIEVKHVGELGLVGFEPIERFQVALSPPYDCQEVWLCLSKPRLKPDGSALWGWRMAENDFDELDLSFISTDLMDWVKARTHWYRIWQELVDMPENQEVYQLPLAI